MIEKLKGESTFLKNFRFFLARDIFIALVKEEYAKIEKGEDDFNKTILEDAPKISFLESDRFMSELKVQHPERW